MAKKLVKGSIEEMCDRLKEYAPTFYESMLEQVKKIKKLKSLTMRNAIAEIYKNRFGGLKVAMKLPEWEGFWFVDDDNAIAVITKDNQYTRTPWFGDFQSRNDWQIMLIDKNVEERITNAKKNGKK